MKQSLTAIATNSDKNGGANKQRDKDYERQELKENMQTINSFLAKMDVFSKEVMKPVLRSITQMEECQHRSTQCLYLVEVTSAFMVKNYNLVQSLEFNKVNIFETVDDEVFLAMFRDHMDPLHDFDVFQEKIRQEKVFLKSYFQAKEDELENHRSGRSLRDRGADTDIKKSVM